MRSRFTALFAVSMLVAGFAAAQLPAEMPKPDPGLWQMQTTMAQMGGMGMGYRMCIGDDFDDLMMQPDDDMECRDFSYQRDGNRIVYRATCQADGSTARVEGVFTGDFRRSYQGNITTTFSPPLEGMSRADMTLDAQWVGPCAPGQKSGDMVMDGMPNIPGMGDIDMEALMQQLEKLQQGR